MTDVTTYLNDLSLSLFSPLAGGAKLLYDTWGGFGSYSSSPTNSIYSNTNSGLAAPTTVTGAIHDAVIHGEDVYGEIAKGIGETAVVALVAAALIYAFVKT